MAWSTHWDGLPTYGGRVGSRHLNPSQLHLRTRRLYQGRWSSCVAFALSSSMWTSARLNGWAMESPPSMAYLYSIGRAREWAGMPIDHRPPFADTGMYMSVAIRAVQELGFVSDVLWPYDEDHVEREPSPSMFRVGIDSARGLTWSTVYEGGRDRVEQVREALLSEACVVFSMVVDRAFEMNDGAVIRGVSEKTLGEHGMRVLALDDDNQEVIVENWWDRWGVQGGTDILGSDKTGGVGRIAFDLFQSDVIGNVNVIHLVRK